MRNLARVRGGQQVLVVGAAGGVGSSAVQIARALGATVTGVVGRGGADLVRGLGAAGVLDHTTDDAHQGKYDVLFDTVYKQPFAYFGRLLADDGAYLTTGFSPGWPCAACSAASRRAGASCGS